MKQLNGLPVFRMTINEHDDVTGVDFISLVDEPAIETNFVAFSDKKKKQFFFDTDRQMLTGPAMIPDLPIYRYDEQMGEYYVTFTKEDIEIIARKFAKQQRTLGINYQHQENSQVDSAVIVEYWFISDKQNDKSNIFDFDLPIGTWMVTTYIADSKFWKDEVKSGNVRGYSIEGFLNLEMRNIDKNKMKTQMSKVKMKAEIKTVDGVVLSTPADSFVEGSEVYMVDGDGNEVPATDGDYSIENGSTISIKDGKVTAVIEVQQSEEKPKFELTPDDVKILTDAIEPMIKELTDRIVALEEKIATLETSSTEMKTAMAKTAGAGAVTVTEDKIITPKTKMSLQDKLEAIKGLKK